MSDPNPNVIDLIKQEEEDQARIDLVTPPGSPVPDPIKKEPTPPPPEPKVVTSGPATLNQEKMVGVKVVQSASAGAAGGSAEISKPGAAAEARLAASVKDWYHYQNTKNAVPIAVQKAAAKKARENARAGWDAANGRGAATTVVKSEPGAGGSANTVVKSEPGAGGSVVDHGETTEESEEEERPQAGGKMRVHKPPGPRRKPYER
tara:strand:+ start:216 stop:830 length:615 start_codon:yes stop_codon:yes gene_type:complete